MAGHAREAIPWYQFDLATLMLTTSLIAVCLGAGRFDSALGIALTVISGPAYLRTCLLVDAERQVRSVSVRSRVGLFIDSLFVIVAIGLFSAVAIVSTILFCLALGLGIAMAVGSIQSSLWQLLILVIAALAGTVGGGAVLIRLLRRLWPGQGFWAENQRFA